MVQGGQGMPAHGQDQKGTGDWSCIQCFLLAEQARIVLGVSPAVLSDTVAVPDVCTLA